MSEEEEWFIHGRGSPVSALGAGQAEVAVPPRTLQRQNHIRTMLYFEDLRLGDTFNTAGHTVMAEEIIAFGLNPSPSRTGRGKLKLHCRTLNQDGKTVQAMTANLLVARRPHSAEVYPPSAAPEATRASAVAQPRADKSKGRTA